MVAAGVYCLTTIFADHHRSRPTILDAVLGRIEQQCTMDTTTGGGRQGGTSSSSSSSSSAFSSLSSLSSSSPSWVFRAVLGRLSRDLEGPGLEDFASRLGEWFDYGKESTLG
jgi:hypothetical protein